MSDPKYKYIGSIETRAIEECGELIQALCKAKRFGWNNSHPDTPYVTNKDDVLFEIEDVITICNELKEYVKTHVEEHTG